MDDSSAEFMRPAPAQAAVRALNILHRHLGDFFRYGWPLAALYLLLHGLDRIFAYAFGVVYSTANFVFGLTWLIEPFVCALFCMLWMRLLLVRGPEGRFVNPVRLKPYEGQFIGAFFLCWFVAVDLPAMIAGFLTPDGSPKLWLAVFAPVLALCLWGVSIYMFYFPARAAGLPWTARQSRKASFNLRGPAIKAGLLAAFAPVLTTWVIYLLRVKLADSAVTGILYYAAQMSLLLAWIFSALAATALGAGAVCHYLQWYRKTGRNAPWVDRDAPA